MTSSSELTERIREQYDQIPYPPNPIEEAPYEDLNYQFIHNYITPYYLRYGRLPNTDNLTVLDVGCGSGYSTLELAAANPTAQVVGIDLSERSVEFARKRIDYHGFGDRVTFQAMSVDQIDTLGQQFDYINCDETLYILPNQVSALEIMRSVLKPDGIIRTNLHSRYQREATYRAQELCQQIGLAEEEPGEFELQTLIETMNALKGDVNLKQKTWHYQGVTNVEDLNPQVLSKVKMNFFLQGDKGFTVPELFNLLGETGLDFISMVDWPTWQLRKLFKDPDNLPMLWEMSLPEVSPEVALHIYDLINPTHRLLDFWCGNPLNVDEPLSELSSWTTEDWLGARVHLTQQLQVEIVKQTVHNAIQNQAVINLGQFLQHPLLDSSKLFIADSTLLSACVLPLLESPATVASLVERWQQINPIDRLTLQPISQAVATDQIIKFLQQLSGAFYVLAEPT